VTKVFPHAAGFTKNDILQLLQENEGDVERTIADFEEGKIVVSPYTRWLKNYTTF